VVPGTQQTVVAVGAPLRVPDAVEEGESEAGTLGDAVAVGRTPPMRRTVLLAVSDT
jgi:hypothetical protein